MEKTKLDELDFKILKKYNKEFGIYYLFAATKNSKSGYGLHYTNNITIEQQAKIREILGLNK